MRKAIGYVRVSTTEQTEEGVSLDMQRGRIAAYATLHGLAASEVFADEGLSGSRASNRPGLQAALRAVCQCKGVLVVHALDRLARNTRDAIDIATRIDRAGADLAILDLHLDTSTPVGEFVFTLMAGLGQLERRMIADRTRAALAHKRRQGERVTRFAPYGQALGDDGLLRPVPAEQQHLAAMVARRAEGWTFRRIAEELNENGVPTKQGGPWLRATVWAVLRRLERDGAAA